MTHSARWILAAGCAALLASSPTLALDEDDALGFERTPPRLAFTEGEVSFLRVGAEEWTPALVNTALAPGDALYTGASANLELQVAARGYVRAGEDTQVSLESLEPDYLQLQVTDGHVSLDLRSRKSGQTFEFDTPHGAFTVEHIGYYHLEVDGDVTAFTSRRGGRASLTLANGEVLAIGASEQVVLRGTGPQIESYAAPEPDAWDRWNYARTDEQIDAISARYVPRDIYGVNDLDHYGDWRVVPTYGSIWVPRRVAANWAPYSTGRWIYDPFYGWTWIDDAPWGWAPYHYGRWVRVSGYWGWSPGPIVARPYYAPALVAFYGSGLSIGVTTGSASIGWVALGWGEPLVPWWGPPRFRSSPRWAGWGGPRYVNQVIVKNTTIIQLNQIHSHRNARERNAFVTVQRDHFGRRDADRGSFRRGKPDDFRLVHDEFPVRPDRSSLVGRRGKAVQPPADVWKRPVVATRNPRRDPVPEFESRRDTKPSPGASPPKARKREKPVEARPPVQVVSPRSAGPKPATRRAPFAKRGEAVREPRPPAPNFDRSQRNDGSANAPRVRDVERQSDVTPRAPKQPKPVAAPQRPTREKSAKRNEPAQAAPPSLPGEPANRVFRKPQQRHDRPQPGGTNRGTESQGDGRKSNKR